MRIKNLCSWAGHDFSHGHNSVVDIDDETAKDRIAAGVAEAVDGDTPLSQAFDPNRAEEQIGALTAERDALAVKLAKVKTDPKREKAMAALTAERDELAAKVETLTAQLAEATKPAA